MASHGPGAAPEPGGAGLYEVLGLTPGASEEAIRSAVTEQRRTWRRRTASPDIALRQEAERRMQQLDQAERTLLDPGQRRAYDAQLRSLGGPPGQPQPGQPQPGQPQPGGPPQAGPPQAGPPQPGSPAAPGAARPAGPASAGPASAPHGAAPRREEERWLVRALEQIDREQYEVAAFTARRAVEADPENSYAWMVLAEAAARSGDAWQAKDAIERALSLAPEDATLHAMRGWILAKAGELARAVSAYRTAARLDSTEPDYRVRAVRALIELGSLDDAITEAEAAYQLHPDDGDIRTALAQALAERAVIAQHELPNGRLLITTAPQASYVEALSDRGLSVNSPDPAVNADLRRQREYARRAQRRRFSMSALRRNYRLPLGFGLLSVAGCCCAPSIVEAGRDLDTTQLLFLLGLAAVLVGFVVVVLLTCFEPQYKRNAVVIEHTVPRRRGRGPGDRDGLR